jgi:hypothetical protein
MAGTGARFFLFLQRNWQGQAAPTGDKIAAFIYNKLPDAKKMLYQVNFITPENLSQVRESFPMVDGTPMVVDMHTGTPVRSGDATVMAMLQLAYSWGMRIVLAELHPSCAQFDQAFAAMIA